MSSATDRLEFAPPRAKGSLRAFALAMLVHILLIGALTWGVSWKRSDEAASFEAELWSNVQQQAAPKLTEPSPPTPAPTPAPVPVPTPAPAPPPPPPPPAKAPEASVTPAVPDVDIALEQEKKRKLQQQLKRAEAQKAEKAEKLREQRDAELQAKKEKEKERELAKKEEKVLKAKEELATRKAQEEARKAEAKKQEAKDQEKQKLAAAAPEKQKLAAAAADKQKLAAAAAEKARQDNLKRMMGMAGASGAADATGSAQSSSGPSAGYAGKVKAKVLPNVVFTDDITGNPTAEVEVRTTADGTIMSQRLIKSSGNKAWDDAVIKAIVRTGSMPRDTDGRVPTPMIVEFRPRG